MSSSAHSKLVLHQILQASLPQKLSLELLATHAAIVERLASGESKSFLIKDLCKFCDDSLRGWSSMAIGDLGNGHHSVGEVPCELGSVSSLKRALLSLPDIGTIYPVGKLSVESSVWMESCPGRTVKFFGCSRLSDAALLVYTSTEENRLHRSDETLLELVVSIAAFVIAYRETKDVVTPPIMEPLPVVPVVGGLAAAAALGSEGVLLVDSAGTITEASAAMGALLGQSEDQLTGSLVYQLGVGSEAIGLLKSVSSGSPSGSHRLRLRSTGNDGAVWVEMTAKPLPNPTSSESLTALFFRDIRHEKVLEAEVQRSHQQLSAAINAESLLLFTVDRRGVIISAQGGLLEKNQTSADVIVGRSAWSFCQDPAERRRLWRELRRGGRSASELDTEIGSMKLTLSVAVGPNGKPQTVYGIAVEAPKVSVVPVAAVSVPSEVQPVEFELCPSWIRTLATAADAVVMTDAEGKMRYVNGSAEKLFACLASEAHGQRFQHLGKFGEWDPILAFQSEGRPSEALHQVTMTRHDGTTLDLDLSGAAVRGPSGEARGVILCCREAEKVSSEKASKVFTQEDRERIENESFRGLARFAGGIAHDLNNILTSLVGNVSLANMLVSDVPEASERLIEAERACFRAKDLSHQLLTFAKGSTPVKRNVRLEDLIKQSTDTYLRGAKAIPRIVTKQGLWSVNVDEGQISQVFENLILNADHSMPHGGMITIASENVHHIPTPDDTSLPLPEGVYVKVSVIDEGPGIPQDQLEYIFRPYHTANESGRGLGLATTFTIIKNHGGFIMARSNFGQGTEFVFYLPATGKTKQPMEEPAPLRPGETRPAMDHGRILVIDDEKSIRDLATTTLKLMGCDVTTCSSSSEGVERFIRAKQDGQPYDLVIMDLTIPGDLGGNEAMQQILSVSPKALGVASSGYSEGSIMAHYREYGFQAALSKPYNIADLQRVVSNMLIS